MGYGEMRACYYPLETNDWMSEERILKKKIQHAALLELVKTHFSVILALIVENAIFS